MKGKCIFCEFEGLFDWQWFVVNKEDEDDSFYSDSLLPEYWNNEKYEKTESYNCPECGAFHFDFELEEC